MSDVRIQLAKEWHPTRNGLTIFSSVALGSHKKFWWVCAAGHEWETRVDHRSHGHGCPYCSGLKPIAGVNDFATLCPVLLKEWHPTKNEVLKPNQVSKGSAKKVWWQCVKGHEWESSVRNRASLGQGCPTCGGKIVLAGFNDVATTHPHLVSMLHPTLNGDVTLDTIGKGSHKRLTWLCSKEHRWEGHVFNITRGYGCPYCSGRKRVIGVNNIEVTNPEIAESFHSSKNVVELSSLSAGTSTMKVWWQCVKGHEWEATPYNRKKGDGCPKCSKRVSRAEKTIVQFLTGLGVNVVSSDRKLLNGKELDILIPDYNFAVEFNGLYWHTEKAGKGRHYHYDKWLACKEAGVQLVQVWDDDYLRSPELVHNMLAHKLGFLNEGKVFARKTVPVLLSKLDAETFLNKNHIQGFVSGSEYAGLTLNGDVVAVLVVNKNSAVGVYQIVRYATSVTVVGGFTKLLSFFEKRLKPSMFITFSDNCVSDGGLYESNGFVADKELAPDYMYVVGGVRQHKFGYRLAKFRNDPGLKFVAGYTESKLADLNGLERVWDAGKIRWVKKL